MKILIRHDRIQIRDDKLGEKPHLHSSYSFVCTWGIVYFFNFTVYENARISLFIASAFSFIFQLSVDICFIHLYTVFCVTF